MNILDGKKVADHILKEVKKTIGTFTRPPGLAFVIVGDDPASQTYVKMKKKKCMEIGIVSKDKKFPADTTEKQLIAHIQKLNTDPTIDGILIQQPLPPHLRASTLMEAVDPDKDVDGFHPVNMGRLLLGETNGFIPCTPEGIHRLLHYYKISLSGKHVVILGRSNIVGKPLSALLVQKNPAANATVTIAHTGTKNIKELTQSADILIAAMGSPHFVKAPMIKKGAVVVDVGINRNGTKIVGDVDFERVAPLCSHITPVPGGIGPMTIAMLLSNTALSVERKHSH
ncbi:MAG TPA: bifunctional methylenetetrahydrofolate dehydrogenase/methenyltetrahydrofolate cyclohydrolase FolD [Rhabdochlamydiaceae bacterium]|jgi:methylenetetrahydrofolate dehydrogenase (NADP+)/methenyltetrahydrofolate cyclohydrolase|nr:bifunctional methylenetetrahydrofolate dehydrogenase/methenyltetrahydrofolate cyclohydrolase FolD [Rhabdochlamydiaceae bacterium]